VASIAAGALGWLSPELLGGKASRDRAIARTEAIAAWTEMLRDTMSAAHGLEQALQTTAPLAPEPIRAEVMAMTARLQHQSLADALRGLADELAHPTADLVIVALTMAAQGAARELGALLGTLAEAARDETSMQLRVEATRARLRTAVRVIGACTIATAATLVLLNRAYVAAYSTLSGQAVLAVIIASWGLALWWLARMSRFSAPERFLLPVQAGNGASR
jgi:Flp pilus assembly protein TadB